MDNVEYVNELRLYNQYVDSINALIPKIVDEIKIKQPDDYLNIILDNSKAIGWLLVFHKNNDDNSKLYDCLIFSDGKIRVGSGHYENYHEVKNLHHITNLEEKHFRNSGYIVGLLHALVKFYEDTIYWRKDCE